MRGGNSWGSVVLFTTLGLTEQADILYRTMLSSPDCGVAELATRLGWSEQAIRDGLDQLADLSLLYADTDEDGAVRVTSPRLALESLLAREQAEVTRRQQELVASRAAADRLLAEYTELSKETRSVAVYRYVGVEAVRRRIAELAQEVRRESAAFAPGGPQPADNRAASRPIAEALAERGIKGRTVYLDSVRNDPASIRHAEWHVAQGNEIRTVPSLPMRMHIVDGETALVPLDPDDSSKGAAEIREPGAVAGFCALFETVWANALPFGEPPRRGLEDPGSQHRELLRLLAQGFTDEAAARRLGVSLRTERRLISELMERLDARSRFQLGQRAMEHGLL